MKKYKVLIVGLGSIGKRHARLLQEISESQIYVLEQRDFGPEDYSCVEEYCYSWDDLKAKDLGFAVICNPTVFHVETALILAKNNIPFLMEKPVCTTLENTSRLIEIVNAKQLPVLVGFYLRHHYLYKRIKEIQKSGQMGKLLSTFVETGQYLPEWRDYDYTKSVSAHKEMGGGVIFDLTHELDLAFDLSGEVGNLHCFKDKVTGLKIDTEDIAEITLSHKNGSISHIHLDYIQKEYTRKFKLIFENGEIFWDYAKGKIRITGQHEAEILQPKDYSRDDIFRSQYEHWFHVLERKESPLVSLESGIYVSKLAISAHQSSEKKQWITLL